MLDMKYFIQFVLDIIKKISIIIYKVCVYIITFLLRKKKKKKKNFMFLAYSTIIILGVTVNIFFNGLNQ